MRARCPVATWLISSELQNWLLAATWLILCVWVIVAASIKGSPQLTSLMTSEELSVTVGENFRLTCPVTGSPIPIFEWNKDKEEISEASFSEYRIRGSTLSASRASFSDEGVFECIGINGFGQARYAFFVRIKGNLSSSLNTGLPPRLKKVFPESPFNLVERFSGQTIKFTCLVDGLNQKDVFWHKDGKAISDGVQWKDSASNLVLKDLTVDNSGLYSCFGKNPLGSVAHKWTLKVTGGSNKELTSWPLEVINSTVFQGESAVLICKGWSELRPHVKWLRRIKFLDDNIPDSELLTWKDAKFAVMKEANLDVYPNGSFVSQLIIPSTSTGDAGVYVCTATNNVGFSHREAGIVVLGKNFENRHLLIACVLPAVLISTFAIVLIMKYRRSEDATSSMGQTHASLLPKKPAVCPTMTTSGRKSCQGSPEGRLCRSLRQDNLMLMSTSHNVPSSHISSHFASANKIPTCTVVCTSTCNSQRHKMRRVACQCRQMDAV